MSVVTVAQVKLHLRQFLNADDALIGMLIDGAEDELKRYLDRDELPRRDDPCADCVSDSTADPASDSDDLAPGVRTAVFFIVQASYEGIAADERQRLRDTAFEMVRSYRCRMGA